MTSLFFIQDYDLERPLDRSCGAGRFAQTGVVADLRRGDDGQAILHSQCSGGTDPNAQTTPVAADRVDQRDRLPHVLPLDLDHIVTPNRKSPRFLLNNFALSVYHLSDVLSLTFVEFGRE